MKSHATKCKICGRPMTVEVDEFTGEIGGLTFQRVLLMATHDRCYDLHIKRRTTFERLKKLIDRIQATSVKDVEARDKLKTSLSINLRTYARALCDQAGATDLVIPVDDFTDAVMVRPEKADNTLKHLRAAIRHTVSQQEMVIP